MRMPYWQFLLHIGLLSLAVQRGAAAYMLSGSNAETVVVVCYWAQAVFAVLSAIAMWRGLSLQIASVVALAAVIVTTSVVQAFVLGAAFLPTAVGQAMLAVLVSIGVIAALRYADAHPD